MLADDSVSHCLDNSLGRTIEKHIRRELRGVVIEPWSHQLDGEDVSSGRPNVIAAVVAYMPYPPPGKFTVNEIADALGLMLPRKPTSSMR